MRCVSENKNDIELFEGEEDVIIEPNDNVELYDVKGNLITAKDAKNTLPDNTELIQKAIDGDKDAFNELYMQSYRYVFFVVRNYIPDDETAYDVIQEVFIKVYKNISKLRSPAAYYGWITVIAKNTACDFVRAARFESPLSYEQEDYRDFLNDDATEKDVSLDIETMLKKLSSEEAELLSLVYYDGMSISQIAKMQGVPKTTVYSRFNKAKKNLKVQLNAHGIDKAIYSGNFIAMITTAMRNIIGTALLSVAIAQQILDSIISGKGKKEIAIAKIIKSQQKKSILKIASVIVAISMITSALTALTLIDWGRFKFLGDENFLNETSTVTEYYYETDSDNGSSSNNDGGFWGNLFGNNGDSADSSITSNDSYNSSNASTHSSDVSATLSSGSGVNGSNNTNINGSTPSYSTPDDSTSTDNPDEVINVFGNNPNNVSTVNSQLNQYVTGLVAKQGEWIYYVQQYNRIMKVKTDGSNAQMVLEVGGFTYIECLNVIGDTIYYINGGIWSVKTDGTNRKQHTTKSAHDLLVRGTTGWFVENVEETQRPYESRYNLYQIDFTTDAITTIVENGVGFGLKTVVDNKLIYANEAKIYSRDLSTGSEEVIFDVSSCDQNLPSNVEIGIANILIDSNYNMYVERNIGNTYTYGYATYKFSLNQPNVVGEVYTQFENIYNYFNYNGGVFYASDTKSYVFTFYDLQGNTLCETDKNCYRYYGVYTFDDGYAYYYDTDLVALYRCLPDGTDLKVY